MMIIPFLLIPSLKFVKHAKSLRSTVPWSSASVMKCRVSIKAIYDPHVKYTFFRRHQRGKSTLAAVPQILTVSVVCGSAEHILVYNSSTLLFLTQILHGIQLYRYASSTHCKDRVKGFFFSVMGPLTTKKHERRGDGTTKRIWIGHHRMNPQSI